MLFEDKWPHLYYIRVILGDFVVWPYWRPGHVLVIPRQHVDDYFELGEAVQTGMLRLDIVPIPSWYFRFLNVFGLMYNALFLLPTGIDSMIVATIKS